MPNAKHVPHLDQMSGQRCLLRPSLWATVYIYCANAWEVRTKLLPRLFLPRYCCGFFPVGYRFGRRQEAALVALAALQAWLRRMAWHWKGLYLRFGPVAGRGQLARTVVSLLEASVSLHRTHADWDAKQLEYQRDTALLGRGRRDILCPDDRVKQYRRRLPEAIYFLMMACLSNTWQATCLTPEEANAWCLRVLRCWYVPVALQQQFGVRRGGWHVPYGYIRFHQH